MTVSVTCYACGAETIAITGGVDALKLRGWTEREPKGMLCPKCSGMPWRDEIQPERKPIND